MKNKRIAGFTLLELMISMVLAALVMTMALNIYIDMKNQYIKLDTKHKINTKQLTIKQIFYNAIGSAGFSTKYGDMYQDLVDNSGDNFGDIFGKAGIITIGKSPIMNMPSLPEDLSLEPEQCKEKQKDNKNLESMNIHRELHCVQPKTDFIMIQRASLDSSLKTNSSNNIFKANEFKKGVIPEKDIKFNDYLVLCNSSECELEKTSAVTGDFVSTTRRVEDKFKIGDYIGKYILETFFIADTGRKDKHKNEIYALYEFVKQGQDDTVVYEIIDNVSDLHIEYVLNEDIEQGNPNIKWQKIADKIITVRSDKIAALKISFKVDGKEFSKIYLTGA